MGVEEMQAVGGDGEIAIARRDRDAGAQRQRDRRRPLDAGAGITEAPGNDDAMVRLARGPERRCGQESDITVALQLRPGPAVPLLVDDDGFAVERFGVERGVRRGRSAQRRDGADDSPTLALGEARRLDPAAQGGRGEIGPRRGDAAIEGRTGGGRVGAGHGIALGGARLSSLGAFRLRWNRRASRGGIRAAAREGAEGDRRPPGLAGAVADARGSGRNESR